MQHQSPAFSRRWSEHILIETSSWNQRFFSEPPQLIRDSQYMMLPQTSPYRISTMQSFKSFLTPNLVCEFVLRFLEAYCFWTTYIDVGQMSRNEQTCGSVKLNRSSQSQSFVFTKLRHFGINLGILWLVLGPYIFLNSRCGCKMSQLGKTSWCFIKNMICR